MASPELCPNVIPNPMEEWSPEQEIVSGLHAETVRIGLELTDRYLAGERDIDVATHPDYVAAQEAWSNAVQEYGVESKYL